MIAKFFKAPTYSSGSWSTFANDFVFASNKITSYEYKKHFTKVGDFTMVLPFREDFLRKLEENGTVFFDSDWLWIQTLKYDGKQIVLSGKDIKGLLDTRIALFGNTQISGAEGYDVVSGDTAHCIKHYLDNNCIAPDDTARILPLTWGGGDIGIYPDNYMTRLEFISDIVNKMCENAEIGYDVKGKLTQSGFDFILIKGVDRSHLQSDRPRVIFSAAHGNVKAFSFEHSIDDLYNEIYAEDANGIIKPVARGSESTGILRRECTVSAGISSTDPATSNYFDSHVLNEIADNIENHSYNIDPSDASGYGAIYNIGDYVTVLDDYTHNLARVQITEVTKNYSQGKRNISVVFGRPKQKPLQKVVNSFISGTARRR